MNYLIKLIEMSHSHSGTVRHGNNMDSFHNETTCAAVQQNILQHTDSTPSLQHTLITPS